MLSDESVQSGAIEFVVNVLNQAKQNLHEYDYSSAQFMVKVAQQALDDLQRELDRHCQTEEMLRRLFDESPK